MNRNSMRTKIAAAALAIACAATGCGTLGVDAASTAATESDTPAVTSADSSTATVGESAAPAEAPIATATATTSEVSDPIGSADVQALPDETITLGSDLVTITQGGTYTLTGDGTAGVVIETDEDVVLVLDGARIVSGTGAAIAAMSADNVYITLADGSENYLEDAGSRIDPEVNGTLYSAADLSISGSGTLTVVGNYEDGIVTKDDLEIASGTIVVTATDDGIRGRDSITVTGGAVTVTSGGDGLKTTYADDLEKGYVHIAGGTIVVDAGDDAIKAATSMTIDNGTIDVVHSLEGLEALNITINGGDITIYAADDGINAAVGDISGEVFIVVNGGTIDVTVGSGDTDAFDSNGSLLITDGTITVTAPTSSFDADGSAQMTGGTVVVNGQQVTTLPQGMGGGFGGGGRAGGGGGRPGA